MSRKPSPSATRHSCGTTACSRPGITRASPMRTVMWSSPTSASKRRLIRRCACGAAASSPRGPPTSALYRTWCATAISRERIACSRSKRRCVPCHGYPWLPAARFASMSAASARLACWVSGIRCPRGSSAPPCWHACGQKRWRCTSERARS